MSPHATRLALYIAISVLPIWVDFFKLSTDYSVRGLMMPFLSSLLAGCTVARAFIDKNGNNEPPP